MRKFVEKSIPTSGLLLALKQMLLRQTFPNSSTVQNSYPGKDFKKKQVDVLYLKVTKVGSVTFFFLKEQRLVL